MLSANSTHQRTSPWICRVSTFITWVLVSSYMCLIFLTLYLVQVSCTALSCLCKLCTFSLPLSYSSSCNCSNTIILAIVIANFASFFTFIYLSPFSLFSSSSVLSTRNLFVYGNTLHKYGGKDVEKDLRNNYVFNHANACIGTPCIAVYHVLLIHSIILNRVYN